MLATVLLILLTTEVTRAAPLSCGAWGVVSSPNVGSANNDLNGVTTIPANNQVWTAGIYDTNPTPQTLTEFHYE